MATWPTLAEVKQRLDITSDDWDGDDDDSRLTRLLALSIAETKAKVGDWVEGVDVPDDALAQSALERAVEYGSIGEGAAPVKSRQLLYGHRKRFGTA